MRFAFLGSPPFATPVLERLLSSRHRAVALITPPDRQSGRGRVAKASPLVEFARERQLEVLQPANPHEAEFLARLRSLAPDVLLVASYGVILKRELLELAPHGALNVHASLLPRHRGASPIQAALLAGDAMTGVSVQRIVARLDEGDVLVTRERAIGADETSGELLEALAVLGGEAAVDALDRIEAGTAVFVPQDASRATYARKLKKEHGAIDFARPAVELARQVRAMNPWPGAQCVDPKGRELTLLRARAVDAPHADASVAPGTLLDAGSRLVVATGTGALEVLELVSAGKRAMPASEFLRGARLAAGERLSSPPIPSPQG